MGWGIGRLVGYPFTACNLTQKVEFCLFVLRESAMRFNFSNCLTNKSEIECHHRIINMQLIFPSPFLTSFLFCGQHPFANCQQVTSTILGLGIKLSNPQSPILDLELKDTPKCMNCPRHRIISNAYLIERRKLIISSARLFSKFLLAVQKHD